MKTKFVQNFFRVGTAWTCLFIGLFFYYLGYQQEKQNLIKEIFLKVGDVLIIGVILGYLTNISSYFGVFKKDLEDVIYGKEFLKKRNDLDNIWETVTKEMFKSKFPAISKDLISLLKDKYLPVENVLYYNDYNITYELDWVNYEKRIIKSKLKINFDLIAEDRNKIELPIQSWVNIDGLDSSEYSVKLLDYTVNSRYPKNLREHCDIKNNIHEYSCHIDLEGDLRYDINQTIEKVYSFEKDFNICFKARYMINKLTIQLRHPQNISACFIERGTVDKYKEMYTNSDSLERKYKGLLLPQQGYVIALKEIS